MHISMRGKRAAWITATMAAAIACAVVPAVSSPAWALTEKMEFFDSTFLVAPAFTGIVRVDQASDSSVRLAWGLTSADVDLGGGRIIGSTQGCGKAVTTQNRVFSRAIPASSVQDHVAFGSATTPNLIGSPEFTLKSIRVRDSGGETVTCGISFNFANVEFESATTHPATTSCSFDGSMTTTSFHWGIGRGFVVTRGCTGARARVSLALDGLTAGHDYRIVASNAKCDEATSSAAVYYKITLTNATISEFMSRAVPLSHDQLVAMESIRVIDLTAEQPWGCNAFVNNDFQTPTGN